MRTRPCQRCESEWLDYAADMNEVDDIAAGDPRADPRHREATDAEWWAWLLEESGADQ